STLSSRVIQRGCCPPSTTARLRPKRVIGSPSRARPCTRSRRDGDKNQGQKTKGKSKGPSREGPQCRTGTTRDDVSPAPGCGLLGCRATELQWHVFFATARRERHDGAQECDDGDFLALHGTTSA